MHYYVDLRLCFVSGCIDELTYCFWQAMLDHLFTLVCYQEYELGGKSKINEDFG